MSHPDQQSASLEADFSKITMLPGQSVWDYLTMCRARHPELYRRLNLSRVTPDKVARLYSEIARLATHFESKLEKGRGDTYRRAQNVSYLNRAAGFLRLFDLAVPPGPMAGDQLTVLDSLGGNGTMTRIVRASRPPHEVPFIVTSDVSPRMIENALAQDIPAIRLPLQDLIWFDDCTFDAVIVAYGTHHIPVKERSKAIAEAHRVLKPGGRIVLQDFEIGCPTTLWYEDVLDQYTVTGHKFDYFTRQQFAELLDENSFVEVEVRDIYDPVSMHAGDPKQAVRLLLEYVFTLFALDKLVPDDGVLSEQFWAELEAVVRRTSTFKPDQLPEGFRNITEFSVVKDGNGYRAEIPRVCLVATGRRKPVA